MSMAPCNACLQDCWLRVEYFDRELLAWTFEHHRIGVGWQLSLRTRLTFSILANVLEMLVNSLTLQSIDMQHIQFESGGTSQRWGAH